MLLSELLVLYTNLGNSSVLVLPRLDLLGSNIAVNLCNLCNLLDCTLNLLFLVIHNALKNK